MKKAGIKKGFILVLLAFEVSAATPFLIPFSTGKDGNLNALGYAAGAMFWAGLIVGVVGYICLGRKTKNQCVKKEEEISRKRKLPSVFRFFSNPLAKVMDVILIAGLVGTGYCAFHIAVDQVVAVIFLVMLLAGIYTHFLLNGNVYQYIYGSKQNKVEKIERKE